MTIYHDHHINLNSSLILNLRRPIYKCHSSFQTGPGGEKDRRGAMYTSLYIWVAIVSRQLESIRKKKKKTFWSDDGRHKQVKFCDAATSSPTTHLIVSDSHHLFDPTFSLSQVHCMLNFFSWRHLLRLKKDSPRKEHELDLVYRP